MKLLPFIILLALSCKSREKPKYDSYRFIVGVSNNLLYKCDSGVNVAEFTNSDSNPISFKGRIVTIVVNGDTVSIRKYEKPCSWPCKFYLTDTSGYINRGRDTLHLPKHVIIKKKGKYYGTGFGYIRNEPSFHNTTLNNEQHFTIGYSTKGYAPLILSDSYGVMIRDSSGTALAQRDTAGAWHVYDCSKALEETYKILFNKYKQ